MTIEQAKQLRYHQEVHFGQCKVIVGPRGGETSKTETWRVSGQVKTWKRDPNRILIPIKHGLYDNYYIDQRNVADFHLANDCAPTRVETVTV